MVAEAVAGPEQEHGLALELFGPDGFTLRQRMAARHGHEERLVVQRRDSQVGVRERLGEDGAVQLARAQHFQQLGGEVLLQHQRHLRHPADGRTHQFGQQVGPDGVDDAQAQRAGQRVLAALGDFLDGLRLLQHGLGLAHDLLAQGRDGDLGTATLEQLDVELVFQLLHRHRQGGLGNKACFGSAPEMTLAGDGNDVAEFGQGHGAHIVRHPARAAPQVIALLASTQSASPARITPSGTPTCVPANDRHGAGLPPDVRAARPRPPAAPVPPEPHLRASRQSAAWRRRTGAPP